MNVQRLAKILETKNDLIINDVIIDKAVKEGQIIHGARAYNYQSPSYLRKKTYDYDILTTKPKKVAQDVAKTLSRRLGREVEVVKGLHKGTYKVKLGNQTIVDYTQIKRRPKTKKVVGINVRDIKSIKEDAKRLLKNPQKEFRKHKDIDTLQKIQEIEEINKRFNFN